MKVVFPKNIQKGMLAGMTFQIGPIALNVVQLFVVGIGVAAAMSIFNGLSKSGGKVIGIFFAIVTLLIFIMIAFFNISELALIPYVSKLIRNNFLDTRRKFQINYEHQDAIKIAIKKSKSNDQESKVFEQKDQKIDKKIIENMNKE
jgi:hypothetical protein